MRVVLTSFFFLLSWTMFAQNQVGINQPNIDASAVLDMNSTEKGFLSPRLTASNKNNISSPAQGLTIYETTTRAFWYFNGAGWIQITASGDVRDGIGDDDSDTRIYLDFTNGNNQIRFFTDGTLHFRMNRHRFDVLGTGNTVKLGDSTGFKDDGVSNNSAYVGNSAGRDVVNGRSNVAIGYQSMRNNISGSDNVAIGNFSSLLGSNSVVRRYVSIGVGAMKNNTSSGQYSVIGHSAGENHTSQNNLQAIGIAALRSDISGNSNIGIGTRSLFNSTTPNNNVAIGYEAGLASITGAASVYIGYTAGSRNLSSNRLFIGNSPSSLLQGSFSTNDVEIFDDLHVTEDIVYTGNLTDVSDRRLKENIKEEHNILPKLIQLNGYRYHLKSRPKNEFEYGLIAQEVKEVFPTLVRRIDPETDHIGVSYAQFIALILQAEKEQFNNLEELSVQNQSLNQELDALSSRLELLRKKVSDKKKTTLSDLN